MPDNVQHEELRLKDKIFQPFYLSSFAGRSAKCMGISVCALLSAKSPMRKNSAEMGIHMKMYLISDNVDTWTGMRLAGIEGVVVHERRELKDALEQAMKDKSIGIVLLTEKFGRDFPDLVNEVKLNRMPLFVEIPDRHGTGRKPDFITDYVNEAIGLKL